MRTFTKTLLAIVLSLTLTISLGSMTGCGSDVSHTSGGEANHFSVSEGTGDHTCQILIECRSALDYIDDMKEEKKEFIPSDGIILPLSTVDYEVGCSVYDVLENVCQEAGITMESAFTPLYNSYYIEGINQIYQFDGGELSGWTYCVNGEYPNYGASSVEVHDNDVIEWHYTCDLGRDVGVPVE